MGHRIEAQLDEIRVRLGGLPRRADRFGVPSDDGDADLSRNVSLKSESPLNQ
jgi:hypothetical protein